MYNLFIYHASEDEEQARNIKRELAHLHYKVYITADIKGNQSEYRICERGLRHAKLRTCKRG